jgi:Xaa-Pro aminopeptidase
MPRLIEMDWPDHGDPAPPPALSLRELRGRMAAFRARLAQAGLEAGAVYGDREHAANLHWLTGFDPRFEEALLVVREGAAHLFAGNECLPYAGLSPLVAAGDVMLHHLPALSLPSQPRDGMTVSEAVRLALPAGAALGAVGWKPFAAAEGTALAFPAFLLDPLRERAGRVEDATGLLMSPADGLRTTVTAEGIARLEFANAAAARALRRLMGRLREGMTDWAVLEAAGLPGLALSCHVTFATGERAFQGLSSPTGQVIRRGQPLSFNIAPQGANLCRAGWVAEDEGDLPASAQGYLERFVFPYVEAMSEWCALMRPGVSGGEVWARMAAMLPADPFGVTLNPGHLIGLDEWLGSPIFEGSDLPLRSGMAMQMDVIPAHAAWGSTRIEDGYAIADEALRADLAARFPEVEGRCAARAAVMRERLGFAVPRTLLPLSDTCGLLAPFLLAHRRVVSLA